MRKMFILGVVLCLSASAGAQTAPQSGYLTSTGGASGPVSDVSGSFVYFFPSNQYSGFYDKMYGLEVEYRYWFATPLGVSVVGGVMNADVRSANRQLVDPKVALFEDSAQMIPFGLSAHYLLIDTYDWRFSAEFGLRYIFVNTDIRIRNVSNGATQSISQEDSLVSVLRAKLNRRVADQVDLFLGAGVQFDIAAGDISVPGQKLGDDNLKGYSLSFGVQYTF